MMEERLIDANALTRHLIDKVGFYPAMVARAIKDAPTIEAEPVKHGKWMLDSDPGEPWRYQCSECGQKTKDTCMGEPIGNYCPNCGARMDGKDGE